MLHIKCAEPLDTRSINDPSALGQREHLGECGGMHTCVMFLGNLTGTLVKFRQDAVHKSALTHT